jgi:hypothetical protein
MTSATETLPEQSASAHCRNAYTVPGTISVGLTDVRRTTDALHSLRSNQPSTTSYVRAPSFVTRPSQRAAIVYSFLPQVTLTPP